MTSRDLSGNVTFFPLGSFNNNQHVKNYSNCDILGSFYTVGNVSPKDISGNTVWDIYNKKVKVQEDLSGNRLNSVYINDISGNVQYIYNNDISGNNIKVTYNNNNISGTKPF